MIPSVRHETVGPPDSLHRLRIAHLSDLHLWFSARKLFLIEQVVGSWHPDVIALTGDYADTPFGRRIAIDWIGRVSRVLPVCWIAGNHDRWCGRGFLKKLEMLSQALPIDRRDAWITGRTGRRYRFTSWQRMEDDGPIEPQSEPTVVLLHEPAHIQPEKLRGRPRRLLLAGHLHGGQITLWRDQEGRPQPAASCYKWLADRSTIHNVPLIVSRGLGDTLPFRFRTPREIVIVDFYS